MFWNWLKIFQKESEEINYSVIETPDPTYPIRECFRIEAGEFKNVLYHYDNDCYGIGLDRTGKLCIDFKCVILDNKKGSDIHSPRFRSVAGDILLDIVGKYVDAKDRGTDSNESDL